MRGVTSGGMGYRPKKYIISTHTPHARRDLIQKLNNDYIENFNSHASCEA